MGPVVTDAGPLHYLVLTEAAEVLPKLFVRVLVPGPVATELGRTATPAKVREWLLTPPPWLTIRAQLPIADDGAPVRGAGERAAIELALSVGAHLLLMDDRDAVASARAHGLATVGTLGLMVRAAQMNLLDLRTAFSKLRETNFRCRPELLDALLAQHSATHP